MTNNVELYSAWASTKYIEEIINNEENIISNQKINERNSSTLIEIVKIKFSRELNKKTLESEAVDNILTRYAICESSSPSKNIYIPIGFSRNAYFGVDFYRSIQDSGAFAESSTYKQQQSNYINKSVFKHGSRIPLRYFKRCLNIGFTLIFTGFEFGAAIAAFVVMRLLLFEKEDLTPEAMNRIRFIGFGCPLFVGEELKNQIENNKLSDRFLFFRNDNDINVNFRDLQSILSIATHEWDLKVRDQNFDPVDLRAMSEGFREVFSFQRSELWNSTSAYFDQGYSSENKLFKQYLKSLENVTSLIDNFKSDRFYVGFGQHFQVSDANIKKITLTNDFAKENVSKLIKTHARIKEVSLKNYILPSIISNSGDTNKLIKVSGERLEIERKDFFNFVNKVKGYLNDNDDINNKELSMPLMNEEKICYTLDIALKEKEIIEEIENKEKKINNYDVKIKIGVTHRYIDNVFCLFLLKYGKDNKVEQRVPSRIISNDKYSAWYEFVIQVENNENNENDKIKINIGIEFNSFFNQNRHIREEIITKNNILNKKSLIDTLGVDLIYINAIFFYYIFKILSKEKAGNEDNKKRAERILKSLKQIEDSNTLTRSFSMDTNERTYIKAMFKLFGEEVDENFLRRFHWMKATSKTFESILKSVEQIKKNSISSSSDPMRLLLEDMVPKVYYYKRSELFNYTDLLTKYLWFDVWSYYKKYSVTVKETDFGRNIWFFRVDIEGDLFYEFKSRDIYSRLKKNAAVYLSVGKIEEYFKNYLDEYSKNQNNPNSQDKPDIKTELPMQDIRLMNTMKCNSEIREELARSYMVGVIGLKKAGKSKFVELLTQQATRIASAIDETSQMRPYEFSNELTIVDYPHYNSTNELYRVQYTYSRFLLDYVFVLVDAMQIGDSLTIDIYNLLRDLRKQNCQRFCLLLNKADHLWNDDINTKETVKIFLDRKTEVITASLKEINNSVQDGFNFYNESNCIIRLSCLVNNEKDNENMKKAGIITYINFEEEILKILNYMIKPNLPDTNNKFERIKKTPNKIIHQKNCLFKYERRKDVVLRVEVMLTKEKEQKDENDVASLPELIELLTDYGFYDKNSKIFEESKSNPNPKEMIKYQDFFDSSEKTFVIKKHPLTNSQN